MADPAPADLHHRVAASDRQSDALIRVTRFTSDSELRETLEAIFTQFDADNSGQITTSELDTLLSACGIQVSPDKLDRMMREADVDESGAIKFDEFFALVKKDKARRDSVFARVFTKARTAMMANKSYGKMHVRHRAMKAARAVAAGSVVTTTDGQADLAKWQQGDAELSTDDNLARRESLRRHPEVVAALDAFFEYCVKAQLKARLASEGSFEKISSDSVTFITITEDTDIDALVDVLDTSISCDRQGYFAIFIRIYKVLLSQEDNQDAEESIANDWEEDRNGQTYMSREALQQSLFELVDVWTESISAAEYAKFIWDLMGKILDVDGAWMPVNALYCEGEEPPAPPKNSPRYLPTGSSPQPRPLPQGSDSQPPQTSPQPKERISSQSRVVGQLGDSTDSTISTAMTVPRHPVRHEQHQLVDSSTVDTHRCDHCAPFEGNHCAPFEGAWQGSGGDNAAFAIDGAADNPRTRKAAPEMPRGMCRDFVIPSYGPFVSTRERKSIIEVSLPKPSPYYTPIKHTRMEHPTCPPFDSASVTPLPSFESFIGRDSSPLAASLAHASAPLDVDIQDPPTPRLVKQHSIEEPALQMAQLRARRSEGLRYKASRSINSPQSPKSIWTLRPPTAPAVTAAATAKLTPSMVADAAMVRSGSIGSCHYSGANYAFHGSDGGSSASHSLHAARVVRNASADGRAAMRLPKESSQLTPASSIGLPSPLVAYRPGTVPTSGLAPQCTASLAISPHEGCMSPPRRRPWAYREHLFILGDEDMPWPEAQRHVPAAEDVKVQYATRSVFRPVVRAQAKPGRCQSRFHAGWVRASNNRGLQGYAARGPMRLCGSPLVGQALCAAKQTRNSVRRH